MVTLSLYYLALSFLMTAGHDTEYWYWYGKMAFRYNGAQIIYAIFTDVENFEAGFCYCR